MRRFDLLVFDWDGTLSDSLQFIVESMQSAFAELKLEPRDDREIRSIIGLGLEEGIERLFPGLAAAQRAVVADAYRRHWRAVPPGSVPIYPGTRETLAELHRQGYFIGVATGKSRRGLDAALRDSGLRPFVHASRCADETNSKPHPQMLVELMEFFAAAPARTLMIGDSEHDLHMARNAGVAAAAVDHGVLDNPVLLEFQPLVRLASLRDLPGWLDGDDPGPRTDDEQRR